MIDIIVGAAACIKLTIPGTTSFIITCNTCSATGTTYVVTNAITSDTAVFTFPRILTSVSNTCTPLSPKISCILFLASPILLSEKIFLMVSPTLVITATILSKIANASLPNVFSINALISCKWFFTS